MPVQRHRASDAKRGAMAGHLRVSAVENAMIPLPPFEEQAAIVQRVDRLLETYRTLEAEVEHARANTENLHKAILKEAFGPAL